MLTRFYFPKCVTLARFRRKLKEDIVFHRICFVVVVFFVVVVVLLCFLLL